MPFELTAIDTDHQMPCIPKRRKKELEIEPNSAGTFIMARGNYVKVDVWGALGKRRRQPSYPALTHTHTLPCTKLVDQNVQVYWLELGLELAHDEIVFVFFASGVLYRQKFIVRFGMLKCTIYPFWTCGCDKFDFVFIRTVPLIEWFYEGKSPSKL